MAAGPECRTAFSDALMAELRIAHAGYYVVVGPSLSIVSRALSSRCAS